MLVLLLKAIPRFGQKDLAAGGAADLRDRVRGPVHVPDLDHGVRHRAPGGRLPSRWLANVGRQAGATADGLGRRRRRPRRVRAPGRRPVHDQHGHGRRRCDGAPGRPPGSRRIAARARDGQHRRRRGRRPGDDPQAARQPGRRRARSSATSTTTATSCSSSSRRWPPRSTSTGSTPATSGRSTTTRNFQTIVRAAIEHDKPVRIGVNWGSLDQQLLTDLMEANARLAEPARRPRRDDRRDDRVGDALRRAGRGDGPPPRPDHPVGEGVGRPRPRRHVPAAGAALGLPAPPRPDRGRHGDEGDRRVDGRPRAAAQRGDRGHDPRLADAGARRRSRAARWRSPSRSSSRWACARSCPRSPRARAAAGRRRRSSRRWRATSPTTSRTGCRPGARPTRASRT